MDLAKTLIRMAARAFYDKTNVRLILIIDALAIHSTLPNEDLSLLLGIQQKDLRKLCGRLREDRMIAVHSRQETREGMQRPIHRDWYYINFHVTIDAIKYRLFYLTQKVKDLYKPTEEKKDYYCPRCKAEWTQMQVLSSVSVTGDFICQKCDGVLERHETSHEDRAGHERLSRLMSQVDPLLKQLRRIDQVTVPQNDFEEAEALRIPIQRDESVNPTRQLQPVLQGTGTRRSGAAAATGPVVEVSLIDPEDAERERREAARRQEAQNQLPEWHTRSTVTGDRTTLGLQQTRPQNVVGSSAGTPLKAEDEEDKKKDTDGADKEMMDAYFAQLQAEQERERLAPGSESDDEGDEEDEDDELDEADFEDALPSGPSGSRAAPAAGGISLGGTPGIGTPASSANGIPNGVNGRNARKRESPDLASESATPGTSAVGTPAGDDGGPSPAKKARLDPELVKEKVEAVSAAEEEEDSDEGEEFEDAM